MSTNTKNETEKLLDGQKLIADTISVALSKEEIDFILQQVCCVSLTDTQALKRGFEVCQKLTRALKTLEGAREEA